MPRAWHLTIEDRRARYLKHENSLDNAGYVQMLTRPIRRLAHHASDVRRVLDYGCGPAQILVELLRRAGYDAVGYDPLFAGDTVLSHPFDAVMCIETAEHFSDPRTEFRRMAGLLRPAGCLTIMTRFHHGPDATQGWWYARDPTHVAFYSHKTLDWICSEFALTLLHRDADRLAVLRRPG